MTWPVPKGTVLAGDVVQLSLANPAADAGELFQLLDRDEVWQHVPWRPRNAQHLEQQLRERCSSNKWHPWILRTRKPLATLPAGAIVGTTSYLDAHPRDAWLEIGATLYTPAVWGTVVNPETKLLLFGHAFDTLHAGRVQLKTDTRNHRSQQAIARLGGKYEGTLRRHFRREDGTIRDSVLFSVTVDDWPDVRHRLGQRVRTFLGTAERDLR